MIFVMQYSCNFEENYGTRRKPFGKDLDNNETSWVFYIKSKFSKLKISIANEPEKSTSDLDIKEISWFFNRKAQFFWS